MRKYSKWFLAFVFLLPVFIVGGAMAQTDDGNTNDQTQSQNESEKPDTSPAGIQERVNRKKAQLQTRLAVADENRIKGRCKAAQGLVKGVQGRVNGIKTSRANVHKNTVSRLSSLAEKLKAKGLDTTELEGQISELQSKIDSFNLNLADYNQTLSDLAEMKCEEDPSAFKAALESARTTQKTLLQEAKDIRTYINDTIKETLKQLRAQLEATTETNQEAQ